jgi:hypothetical protein
MGNREGNSTCGLAICFCCPLYQVNPLIGDSKIIKKNKQEKKEHLI